MEGTWSSKSVLACLQVSEGTRDKLHVVSCYAPTRAVGRKVKEHFFQEIENIISSVTAGEKCVLLGDFNACVGFKEDRSDQWDVVRGPHGHGDVNDAGK